jgi:hypothetical protein
MPLLAMIHIADDDFAAQVPNSLVNRFARVNTLTLTICLLKGADELSEICSVSFFRLNANGQIETVPK